MATLIPDTTQSSDDLEKDNHYDDDLFTDDDILQNPRRDNAQSSKGI